MAATPISSIHKAVLQHCVRIGLIKKLKKSILTPEHARYKKLKISKEGLHLLDAVHCVYDKNRTEVFLKEISKQVKPDSVVIEAGIGTGILSFVAATKAKRVYGLEINLNILKLARAIQKTIGTQGLIRGDVVFSKGDATKVKMPEKADILINENIYTGMFLEHQVEIMRHMRKFLKRGGKMIPSALRSYVVLAKTRFPRTPKPGEMFVPLQEKRMKIVALSEAHLYDIIDFRKKILARGVRTKLSVPVIRDGNINSILIYTEVVMPSGRIIGRNETIFLNNDIVLALQSNIITEKGDRVRLHISYPYGAKPQSAKIKAAIIR